MTTQDDNDLPLSAAITSLRNEITTAVQDGRGNQISFTVGPIELEFNVVAKREKEGGVGVKFSILGVGAKLDGNVSIAAERTQKVKFTLTPETVDAKGLRAPLTVSRSVAEAGQGRRKRK